MTSLIEKLLIRVIGDFRSSNPNTKRAAITAGYNVIGQVVQLATGVISVPLAVGYLGMERFGYWMAISAVISFAGISDFGLSTGAQDRISKLLALKRSAAARSTFLTALAASTLIALVLTASSELLISLVDIPSLFKLREDETIREAGSTARAISFVVATGIISGVVQRAYFAAQMGHVVAATIAVSRVISLILVFLVIRMQWGLPSLVIAFGALSNIAVIASTPALVLSQKWHRLRGTGFSKGRSLVALRAIFGVGLYSFVATIAYYLLNNSVMLVISTKYGASEVAVYATLAKLTAIPTAFLTNIFAPIWPAITNASVKGDVPWLLGTYSSMRKKTIYFSVIFFIILLIISPTVVRLWTNDERLVPSNELLVSTLVIMVLSFWNAFYSTYLNGLSSYKRQAIFAVAAASLSLAVAMAAASVVGQSVVILIIATGYLLRCLSMRQEIVSKLNGF